MYVNSSALDYRVPPSLAAYLPVTSVKFPCFGLHPENEMPAALADTSQIICEVWASNVDEEMRKIRQIIQNYNYIAMVWFYLIFFSVLRCDNVVCGIVPLDTILAIQYRVPGNRRAVWVG